MKERDNDFSVFAVPGPPIVVSKEAWEKRPKVSKEEWERRMKEIREHADEICEHVSNADVHVKTKRK